MCATTYMHAYLFDEVVCVAPYATLRCCVCTAQLTQVLSSKEREACATLRLLPLHYLALKDMMLRDSEKHGSIARSEV